MSFAQHLFQSQAGGFRLSKQLTQVVESTYNRRVLRYAYDATAQGEFRSP
jgi:hypothetical protein